MGDWSDGWWMSEDGLRLHYRDYGGGGSAGRPPILCLAGLTRNARDFEGVAARLGGEWRLICPDLRGRGDSEPAKDFASYNPLTYLQDIRCLISTLGLERVVAFGTSLGGLIAMLLAAVDKPRLAGVLLNDVGPVLEEAGLDHIRTYVGRAQSWPTWMHAADGLAEAHRARYPDWGREQWLVYAKRLCRLTRGGRIVPDYDLAIAEPIKAPAPPVDLWPTFHALAGIPALLVRGELSDLLSEETARRMAEENPDLEAVTVPRVGHAPTLDEPEAAAGIDRLLARVAAEAGG